MTLRILVSGSLVSLALATQAQAGAFGLREQSTVGLGMAFAGVGAGSAGLGSMYWNPATMTRMPGIQAEWSFSGILPYASVTPDATSSPVYRGTTSGDFGQDGLIMSSYTSYQWNDQVWLGLALNTPFGLSTKPDRTWPGRAYNNSTKVSSFDIQPTIAWKVNDWLSLGAGVQAMYFHARYTSAFPFPGRPIANDPVLGLDGDSWGVGYTLGATVTPFDGTQIGLGFRSAVKQVLEGEFTGGSSLAPLGGLTAAAGRLSDGPFKATAVLPELVTLGITQKVTDQLTLSAGVEWTQWSRLGFPRIRSTNTGGLNVLQPDLPLDFKDGWFFSAGGEYRIDRAWTVRAGLAYEVSPIKDTSRALRLPDNDRIWTSLGVSYTWNDKLSLDLSYAHLFPVDTTVQIQPGNPNYKPSLVALGYGTLNGKIDSHVDIISVGARYRWDDPAKPIPAALPVVRKY